MIDDTTNSRLNHCDVGASAIIGSRPSQQDSYRFYRIVVPSRNPDDGREGAISELFWAIALADGVGGAAAGDVASRLAVDAFIDIVRSRSDEWQQPALLHDAAYAGNKTIARAASQHKAYAGMATTLVGVLLGGGVLHWISVGDSHLYLVRQGKLHKLNKDHSMAAKIDRECALGMISPEEAANAPFRNIILSCLSGDPIEIIDLPVEPWPLEVDDRLIVASDGLNSLNRDDILRIALRSSSAKMCATSLTRAVSARRVRQQDNATVVVADFQ